MSTLAAAPRASAPAHARTAAAAIGIALGALLVLATGFAPIAALHGAAHDTRHAFAFPCH